MDRIDSKKRHADFKRAAQLSGRLLVFALPLAILFFAGEYLLWQCGENWPVTRVVRVQQESSDNLLYSRNLMSQQFGVYKLESIRRRKPEVVVVGSSRVMQFRDFMFAPLDASFYNAGGMVQSIHDLTAFADLIHIREVPAPRVLAIGIDPWWLKQDHDRATATWLTDTDDVYRFSAHVESLRTIVTKRNHFEAIRSTLARKFDTNGSHDTIGIAAATRGSGFRRDGSWQYSGEMLSSFLREQRFIDREKPPIVERIRSHIYQFEPPLTLDLQKQRGLLATMDRLITSGVEVWAVMLPFSQECLRAIGDDSALDDLYNGCLGELLPALQQCGVQIVTTDMLGEQGLPDEYMIDGFHPGEVYSAHLALTMIKHAPDRSLLKQADADQLVRRIEAAQAPLVLDVPQIDSL